MGLAVLPGKPQIFLRTHLIPSLSLYAYRMVFSLASRPPPLASLPPAQQPQRVSFRGKGLEGHLLGADSSSQQPEQELNLSCSSVLFAAEGQGTDSTCWIFVLGVPSQPAPLLHEATAPDPDAPSSPRVRGHALTTRGWRTRASGAGRGLGHSPAFTFQRVWPEHRMRRPAWGSWKKGGVTATSPHLPRGGLSGYALTGGRPRGGPRAAVESRAGVFTASSLPINDLSCHTRARPPFSCQPCHQAEMTGEQTAGVMGQENPCASAGPQSSLHLTWAALSPGNSLCR